MIILPVALATAGASALVNLWLSVRVGQARSAAKVWMGDGGDPRVLARMRAHSNFAEYVPVVLVLIALVELATGTHLWLWIVAALFVAGRVLHGFGMDGWMPGRGIGTLITMLTMVGLGIYAALIPYLMAH